MKDRFNLRLGSYIFIATLLCVAMSVFGSFSAYAGQSDRPNLLLSDKDAGLYITIFKRQHVGQMKAANELIEQLTDKRLMGHVLSQRYLHPTSYTSSFEELKKWMTHYYDHPNAGRIYDLAMRKAPTSEAKLTVKNPKKLTKIPAKSEPTMFFGAPMHKKEKLSSYHKNLEKQIKSLVRRNYHDRAVDKVIAAEKMGKAPDYQIDYLKSLIAEGYMYEGQVTMAYTLAAMAYERSGEKVPLAGWVYGLTTWYNGNYRAAVRGFKSAAISEYESGWMRAAASFWAARAYDRLGEPHNVSIWLTKAQEYPRTFYGLLATQASGKHLDFNWSTPSLTREMVRTMAKSRSTMRALALMDVGRYDVAEEEFLYVRDNDPLMRQALIAFAQSYDMAELSLRLGAYVKNKNGKVFDAALYPDLDDALIQQSVKSRGKKVDLDLLQAIARQESRFNHEARSRSGALGLMQVMPSTAEHVVKRYDIKYRGENALLLQSKNLEIGQYYIHDLMKSKIVGDDLVSVLASYNAGPGNLKKWRDLWVDVSDPLLFIELMPIAETRKYVERVLANYWIYRSKHQRDPSPLMAMVQGKPLTYASVAKDVPYSVAQKR